MKRVVLVGLFISCTGIASTTVDSENITRVKIATQACYSTQGVGLCLQSIQDKEHDKNIAAWQKLTASLSDGVNNRDALLKALKEGNTAWETASKADCKATGLLNDSDSPAYNEAVMDCMAVRYAARTDFYNSFNFKSEDDQEKKMLQDYLKNKKTKS